MNAKIARQLQPGDFVIAPFGNSHRRAQVIRIEWPHVYVCTTLASGEIREQVNRYRALHIEAEYMRTYGDYNH